MKVYISGPIATEIPGVDKEERLQRFRDCHKWLARNKPDWDVVNPVLVSACKDQHCVLDDLMKRYPGEHNFAVQSGDHTWECYLRYDLMALLECDAIVLLPDWSQSKGAQLEYHVASQLGMATHFADEEGRLLA